MLQGNDIVKRKPGVVAHASDLSYSSRDSEDGSLRLQQAKEDKTPSQTNKLGMLAHACLAGGIQKGELRSRVA
jgi:hypothetical protein